MASRDSVGNLPAELTSFVGRREELSEAKALLSSSRLVTLTGMGGVGKTRLARRLLADLHRAFSDGVWQVTLAELHEPALVAATFAAALDLAQPRGRWTIGKLQERLAGRHLLLLVDNCEHLLDACAVTIDALLRACPELRIVATSRQPLGIDGECTLVVAPLATPDPGSKQDLHLLDHFDATRLFVERASAALPGFAVTEDNRQAVAELCFRLDGLPLALEFSAVRVRALSVAEIVACLDRDSPLSSSGSRIAPSRQQSLRALVDWSYQLCSEDERLLWTRLSVFTGNFDITAAEALGAVGDVEPPLADLIVGLVEKSVLSVDSQAGQVRYRMPRTVRAYGLERLTESGKETEVRTAHRDYYVRLTADAHRHYAGPDQLSWFSRLRGQHDDISAALAFSLRDSRDAQPGGEILIALLDYWIAFGFLSEARHWLDVLLEATPDAGLSRARALRSIAYVAAFQDDVKSVTAALAEARPMARSAGDQGELAWCALAGAVSAMLCSGELTKAQALSAEAIVGMRTSGDEHGLVNSFACQTVAIALSGDASAAQSQGDDFLAVTERLGERRLRAYALWALGVSAWRAGDHARAADLELESLRLRLLFDDHVGIIWSAEVLAWIKAGDGDPSKAARLLGAAKRAAESIGTSVNGFAFLVEDHQRCEAQLRGLLGDAEFEAAASEGAALLGTQILELVAGPTAPPTPTPLHLSPETSPLTRREREIATLVADGLSNKEIASELVIATRTAEGHVEHILVKLGFTSRTQIATWVAEQRSAEGPRKGR